VRNKKIGRNEKCLCGSNRKYKFCHGRVIGGGSIGQFLPREIEWAIAKSRSKLEANERQRIEQQGLGKPIISVDLNGERLVVINNKIASSNSWNTFHEFLISYLVGVLSAEWFKAGQLAATPDQHPLVKWYVNLLKVLNSDNQKQGKIAVKKSTGAVLGFLNLAYHLYLLDHHQERQTYLIKRLKSQSDGGFYGAFHETRVFSTFFKAGYEVEFQDESDGDVDHHEFIAVNKKNGNRYCVEAKCRLPNKPHFDIYTQMRKALSKSAEHKRIVFIEMNVENEAVGSSTGRATWQNHIANIWPDMEKKLTLPGRSVAPPAYVIIVNNPYQFYENRTDYSGGAMLMGFKISGFGRGEFGSLLDVVAFREEHADIFEIFEAYRRYHKIPVTFDGSNPHANSNAAQLTIGNYYSVRGPENKVVEAELADAIVDKVSGRVFCTYRMPNGESFIGQEQLSADEFQAYLAHPHTYFGVAREVPSPIENAVGLYDFFWKSYGGLDRSILLDRLAKHPDPEMLSSLSQTELAKIYCAGLASQVHREDQKSD
jgi:hypothetical protein